MSLIEKYNSIQHEILSDLSLKWEPKSENETFQQKVQKYYCFENEFGWNILLNAFYTIEDAEFAKQSFKRFGFQGPSRHEDIGEKYMRLYGVLNAIYQQKLAVQNLLEIHKIPNKKGLMKKLGEQKALSLRNKVAAHSTNHISQNSSGLSKFDVYEISRPDLKMDRIVLLKNQSEFENYDLEQIILIGCI